MVQAVIIGIIQGITEWLPVSSEGVLVLVQVNLFKSALSAADLIRVALFLHLGTFLAALVYFRKEVWDLIKAVLNYKQAATETKALFRFLLISSVATLLLALAIFSAIERAQETMALGANVLTGGIALLLVFTGLLQLRAKNRGLKTVKDASAADAVWAGLAQGFAILPGISRSGFTVAALILKRFNDDSSLRLSFLMSLPAVLGGNIILNYSDINFTATNMVALIAAFIFGLATIHGLLKFAKKVNFAYFVLIFAALMFVAAFL